MKHLPFIIILVFIFNSCTTKEPYLTKREEVFFEEMGKQSGYSVLGGFDWSDNNSYHRKIHYNIDFFSLSDNTLKRTDSLKKFSDIVSKIACIDILEKNLHVGMSVTFTGKGPADSSYYAKQVTFNYSDTDLLK